MEDHIPFPVKKPFLFLWVHHLEDYRSEELNPKIISTVLVSLPFPVSKGIFQIKLSFELECLYNFLCYYEFLVKTIWFGIGLIFVNEELGIEDSGLSGEELGVDLV